MEEYSGYHDDFSEGDGANNEYNEDEEQQHVSNTENDGDDEQYAQKVNGRLERLQSRVEELEQELVSERQNTVMLRQRHELEVAQERARSEQSAKQPDTEMSSLRAELQRYKSKCESLQEKYEISLLTGNSPSALPPALEQELAGFLEKHKVFPELTNKSLSAADAVSILRTLMPKRSRMGTDSGLQEKIRGLEEELRGATTATMDDVQGLKNKIFALSERIRVEKEYKRTAEGEVASCKRKIGMLSEHMEKLVVHLKRESAHKLRLAEQFRSTEKENGRYKEKCELLTKKIAAKDRLLFELREGSKVLEDQLRLMDEKYLELRGKLDWARAMASRKIKKAERTATDLRVKFAMTGSPLLLDNISLPPGGYAYASDGGSAHSEGDGWMPSSSPYGLQQQQSTMLGGGMGVGMGMRGMTPHSRHAGRSALGRSGDSVKSLGSQRSEPSLDAVLEKIRMQQGAKQEWTDEKLKKLVTSR